jgi:periplasmic divalent cation tolerance protein
MREEYIQVSTTVDGKDHAERIAKTLLDRRLAACVQIVGPVMSAYWWKGKLEKTEEWICYIKSRMGLYEKLEEAIRETHTYETPEIVAVPIIAGSRKYLEWLEDELKKK